MKERVKFYRQNDFCYGQHLDKIETMKIPDIKDITINDAIEFYEIKRYFDDGVRSKLWNDDQLIEYKDKSIKLDSLCKQFFNQINDNNIIELHRDIEFGYHSEFWILFDICKLYNKISGNVFASLIEDKRVSSHDLFKHKGIVKKYGNVLREYILSKYSCISVLLHIYEQDYTENEKLNLPNELTGQDICNYLDSYVDSEHPNANYLSDIEKMRYTKEFPITDELRLKAKRRYESEIEQLLKEKSPFEYGYQLLLDTAQEEEKLATNFTEDGTRWFRLSYSIKWLEDSLGFPSILNNFIYIFEFVDLPQMRSMHVSKKTQTGIMEDIFLSKKSSRYYCCNSAFNASDTFARMQMEAYYKFLERNGIQLEDVLRWFFTQYLQEEFSCPEMRVSFPSNGTSFSEKCYTIITAFETIIKQYMLFLRNDSIDFELVGMSTTPTLFKDIGSLIENKYIYGNGNDYNNLTHMLFSNQNLLSHLNRIYEEGRHYDCFFDLLSKETIFLSDYREEETKSFEYLSDFDIVSIEENSEIKIKNKFKIAILRDLYENDVISKQHYSPRFQKNIDELIEQGILIEESTLFSRPEIDYLNYILNRSEFVNGLEIRNQYIHGIQQVNMNEEEHKQNYYVFLRLFVLLAIKINDEFCLKDAKDKLNNS